MYTCVEVCVIYIVQRQGHKALKRYVSMKVYGVFISKPEFGPDSRSRIRRDSTSDAMWTNGRLL